MVHADGVTGSFPAQSISFPETGIPVFKKVIFLQSNSLIINSIKPTRLHNRLTFKTWII